MSNATAPAEDVVVYKLNDRGGYWEMPSIGRDTLAIAEAFIAKPKWPYDTDRGAVFVAFDDWGHGKCVAASPGFTQHAEAGTSFRDFRRHYNVR